MDNYLLKDKTLSLSLYKNSVNKLRENLRNNFADINDNLTSENISFINNLSEEVGISLIALSKFNNDLYNSEKESFKKNNYKFPSFLNIGTLKTWNTTPSKIIDGEMFKTETPILFPLELSSIAFIQNQKYKNEITNNIESIVTKLIASLPNGLSRLVIIDKTGSGQNFPNLIRMNEKFTNGKIISEDNDIENELDMLKHSIATITNSITANGFSSIEDYNNNTDEIPQPYQILVIANFPVGFSKKSTESLLSILESGTKAGIYVFFSMSVSLKHGLSQIVGGVPLEEIIKKVSIFDYNDRPHEFIRKNLLKHNISLFSSPVKEEEKLKELYNSTFKIDLEEAKKEELLYYINDLNERITKINVKPVIDIRKVIPDTYWEYDASAGMCAPFAKNGIENIFISLGINQFGEEEGTHHGLVGGATGSGKTVLLHDIILNAAIRYSPDNLKFWLLDYKEGTEFATYKDFPHVEILSMESEVEFGQEVLSKAISLKDERGVLFKKVGASNLKSYNENCEKFGLPKLHRIVIIIDEFQALFPKKPKITAKTNDLIDQILRLGRSFGINLLLATQTLKGIDMDPQLMSNMPLRIGLKMDKKDVSKLFDENNNAPKSLSNPGEGIYNKQFGLSVDNQHFQAYLALNEAVDEIKEKIVNKIYEKYEKEDIEKLYKERFVYTGDTPANIEDNIEYINHLKNKNKFENMKFFIGEHAGLTKEHANLTLERDFAENLIIIGLNINSSASLFYYILSQLAFNQKNTNINLFNYNKKIDSFFYNNLSEYKNIKIQNTKSEIENLNQIWAEYEKRNEMSEEELLNETIIINSYFFVESSILFSNSENYGVDTPMKKIEKLISEGPSLGIHIIIYATKIQSLASSGINRMLDKFKNKIDFSRDMNDLIKMFGDEGANIEMSNSKNIAVAYNGEIDSSIFKFKPYIHKDFLKKPEIENVV